MYVDNSGLQHESYSDACRYYGADTPEQIAAEMRYYEEMQEIEHQDRMEALGGPVYAFDSVLDDEIPW